MRWIHTSSALCTGAVCLLLSCGRLLNADQLALHCYNLLVNESALPQGQVWSLMTWQILEVASSIPITLFEGVADLDAGPIHLQRETRYRAMSWWMSAVLYRPAPRLSFAWPGVMAISGLWPQPNHKLVLLVITGGANLPIHYLTLICLWLSSLTCFVLWMPCASSLAQRLRRAVADLS